MFFSRVHSQCASGERERLKMFGKTLKKNKNKKISWICLLAFALDQLSIHNDHTHLLWDIQFTPLSDKFQLNGANFLPVQPLTLLHGTVQILFQIAELFAVSKLAWFRVNEGRISVQVFVPSKICEDPCKRCLRLTVKVRNWLLLETEKTDKKDKNSNRKRCTLQFPWNINILRLVFERTYRLCTQLILFCEVHKETHTSKATK